MTEQQYLYQENQQYFAQCGRGIEDVAAEELAELGATGLEPTYRGVHFTATPTSFYTINYCARIPSRILAPLAHFGCHTEKVLHKKVMEIDWSRFLSPDQTFAVFANVSDSQINHSKFAALRVKDAIADFFREKTGVRPSVDTRNPDLWINLNLRDNFATISADTSGGALHRRGYRKASVLAPLQETLAAAILRISGWQGERPLVDPMCGSGTILAEALMAHCRVPAGFRREKWGFFRLPDFNETLWRKVKQDADGRVLPYPEGLIQGSDIDGRAVDAACENLNEIPGGDLVQVRRRDFHDLKGFKNVTIITNPPYGVRLGEQNQAEITIHEFGDFLKQSCTGSTAWILCGSIGLMKHIGLRTSKRVPLFNGPLETRLVKLDLY
ncbi:MAG: class I SAM-dependent RNA methyltransferase [Acidobacteria bacterium]|nr:class I SAM-dependent RNA methyltransferase [Acidobacteriota bacterium]